LEHINNDGVNDLPSTKSTPQQQLACFAYATHPYAPNAPHHMSRRDECSRHTALQGPVVQLHVVAAVGGVAACNSACVTVLVVTITTIIALDDDAVIYLQPVSQQSPSVRTPSTPAVVAAHNTGAVSS
jgi:hypothetical protein